MSDEIYTFENVKEVKLTLQEARFGNAGENSYSVTVTYDLSEYYDYEFEPSWFSVQKSMFTILVGVFTTSPEFKIVSDTASEFSYLGKIYDKNIKIFERISELPA